MKNAADSLAVRDARRRLRTLKDLVVRHAVTVGGVGVIIAIVLIFFYLLMVVAPLFAPAEMEAGSAFEMSNGETKVLHVSLEEHATLAARYLSDGRLVFFRTTDGSTVSEKDFASGETQVLATGVTDLAGDGLVLGLSDGRLLATRIEYAISYPGNERHISPGVAFPLGDEPVVVDPLGRAIIAVTGRIGDDNARFVSVLEDGTTILTELELETGFLDGATTVAGVTNQVLNASIGANERPAYVLMDPLQEWVYLVAASGDALVLRRRDGKFAVNERLRLAKDDESVTALRFLTGGISLLVGTDQGRILQWFPVRGDNNRYRLVHVRSFEGPPSPVTGIAPEHRRKGFVAGHANGVIGVHYTTSERTLIERKASDAPIRYVAMSPRANTILTASDDNRMRAWQVENEHPEVSWSALWGKVWYESYPEPDYIWQSSSASSDFEPKFSLAPLSFGTLKAAFYAMLVAMPLAIAGAIFTAYFMSPSLRTVVKPAVEVMEALPTVILGFLAGLWLAPLMEANLPAVFLLLLLFPPGIVLCGYAWSRLPASLRHRVPGGWEPALLVLPVIFVGWICFAASGYVETLFFNGNMPQWISNELGIDYDQRNALVVGVAMGFAVIPNIFSIAEDAVFGVPKHLSYGSLALGATPWQTLVRVVLPTASPGIFSGVMIGFGRAVGETMIVLMATGNTPILDMNMFQGMRTLSANIAVEMPESELGSSHYRVLFLAALVLFLFTFLFNTVAELIRQRLRRKYSAI